MYVGGGGGILDLVSGVLCKTDQGVVIVTALEEGGGGGLLCIMLFLWFDENIL